MLCISIEPRFPHNKVFRLEIDTGVVLTWHEEGLLPGCVTP